MIDSVGNVQDGKYYYYDLPAHINAIQNFSAISIQAHMHNHHVYYHSIKEYVTMVFSFNMKLLGDTALVYFSVKNW